MPESSDVQSQRQTSRGQVSRIDRGYFHRRSRFERTRSWLIVAGLTLGVAWIAWGAYDTRLHYSPGAVTTVHAKWENDCNACHVPLSPIKDNTWVSTDATRQAMDRKCEACHRGPAHHPLQVSAEVGSCAS
ncbi:MAG: multiheme c-type cytochrome, partial [Planctomycetia bacterium]